MQNAVIILIHKDYENAEHILGVYTEKEKAEKELDNLPYRLWGRSFLQTWILNQSAQVDNL